MPGEDVKIDSVVAPKKEEHEEKEEVKAASAIAEDQALADTDKMPPPSTSAGAGAGAGNAGPNNGESKKLGSDAIEAAVKAGNINIHQEERKSVAQRGRCRYRLC